METQQYWKTRGIIDRTYDISSTFVVGMIAFPWIGVGFPLFVLLGYMIVNFSTKALRETTKLTALANSPVISYFSESVSGSSSIRAFKK